MATKVQRTETGARNLSEESALCAGELASLAQKIVNATPESQQWNRLRKALKTNSDMLLGELVSKSFKDLQPLLPYIEGVLIIINRCIKSTNTYRTTEKLLEKSSDLTPNARYRIERQLGKSKSKLFNAIQSVENTFTEINIILLRILNGRSTCSYRKMFSFSYSLRSLRGQLDLIENSLKEAVRTFGIPGIKSCGERRSSFATAADMLGKVAFGQTEENEAIEEEVPQTPENTENISEYQEDIKHIDEDADTVTSKLDEWQHKFWTRSNEKVLLFVIGFSSILWAAMAAAYFFEGAPAIYSFFILFSLLLLVRLDQTNERVYYIGVAVAIIAAVIEAYGLPAFTLFNVAGASFTGIEFLAFLESNFFL